MTGTVESPEPCPSCGRMSLHYHRETCRPAVCPRCRKPRDEYHALQCLAPCPKCGRMSLPGHPAVCVGPLPTPDRRGKARSLLPLGIAKGTSYPRCETCHRAIVRGEHRCRPLGRSHRNPETDTHAPSTSAPVALPPLPPFPAEGVAFDCKVASELNLTRWNWRGRRERSKDQKARTHNALSRFAALRFAAKCSSIIALDGTPGRAR